MPAQLRRLLESRSDAFSAGGLVAEVRLGPRVYGETWLIKRITVATTSVADTTARVFLNSAIPQNLIDTTEQGNSDISDNSEIELGTTENIIVRWNGGDPGSIATCVVYGVTER